MEAWDEAKRPAFHATQTRNVAMNFPSSSVDDLRTCAFVSLICPFPSRRQRLRKLRPTRLSLRSNQLTGEGDLRLGSPFSIAFCLALLPSEIPAFLTPVTRHGSLQIGSLAPISGQGEPFGHQSPGSNVIQDSDFPWEIAERLFDSQKISALRASGALRVNSLSSQQRTGRAA
jgi:hypothetical protein